MAEAVILPNNRDENTDELRQQRRRDYMRRYRKENRERILQQVAEWRRADKLLNPEKYRKAALHYKRSNRERVNAKARERYAKNTAAGRAKSLEKYQKNRDREMDRARAYRRDNPLKALEYSRRSRIKARYGLHWKEFECMLDAQQGACDICKKLFSINTRPSVDHCHKSGKIRSLLCRKCNTALGMMGDSPQLLEAAIGYLRRHALLVRK